MGMKVSLVFALTGFFTGTALLRAGNIDSLEKLSHSVSVDTARVTVLYRLASAYVDGSDFVNAERAVNHSVALADSTGDPRCIANALIVLGKVKDAEGEFDHAIEVLARARDLSVKHSLYLQKALAEMGIANAYYFKGDTDKSLQFYIDCFNTRQRMADSSGMAAAMMGIGNVYSDLRQFSKSLDYYLRALGIKERANDKKMVSWLLNNIGTVYRNMGDEKHLMEYFQRSIAIKKELGDDYGLSTTYANLGDYYEARNNLPVALDYYRMCYNIRSRGSDMHELAVALNYLAGVLTEMGFNDKAMSYVDSAIALGTRQHSWDLLKTSYMIKASVYEEQKNYPKAIEFFEAFVRAKDSLLDETTTRQITELAARYENGMKEQQIALQDSKIALQNSEISREKSSKNFMILLSALGFLLALLALYSYWVKRRSHRVLEDKNQLIEHQKQVVEEKQKEILDSIHYAKRIQGALLASDRFLEKHLPEYFVFYRPKDIVSGDFYWSNVDVQRSRVLLAACDCTGHGVPGAFMSLLNISLLNEVTVERRITGPDRVLERVREEIIKAFHSEDEGATNRDGMDSVFCSFDFSNGKLEFACANNPLWIARGGEMIEFKPDKQPVGFHPSMGPFTLQQTQLEKGDAVYIFTDGYADQFGGPKGKKFKYSKLKELLLANAKSTMKEQRDALERELLRWKGDLEQVDDILVIGIRV